MNGAGLSANQEMLFLFAGLALLAVLVGIAGFLLWKRQADIHREAIGKSREEAVLQERARIAREVHDTLLQGLMSISLQAQRALKNLTDAPETAEEALRAIQLAASDTTTLGRRAILRYRGEGKGRGIFFEIEEVAREAAGQREITIDQRCSSEVSVSAAVVIDLLSIIRQSVSNAFLHGAEPVSVIIDCSSETISVTVVDAGNGFDPDNLPKGRHGIRGMIERAQSAQLKLSLPSPGNSRLTVEAPMIKPTAAGH